MKDSELIFDRNCHVLYGPKCRRKILDRIAAHYPDMHVEPYSGDRDPWLKGHAEYRDPDGTRRNK